MNLADPITTISTREADAAALTVAYGEAIKSPDPSTQNGATFVVTEECEPVAYGHNHYPVGTPEDWGATWDDKDLKYSLVVHAEVAATIAAANGGWLQGVGGTPEGGTLAVVWYACTDCAKVMIDAGVRRIVGHQDFSDFASSRSSHWADSIDLALRMLREADVECAMYSGPLLGAPPVLCAGRLWSPWTLKEVE